MKLIKKFKMFLLLKYLKRNFIKVLNMNDYGCLDISLLKYLKGTPEKVFKKNIISGYHLYLYTDNFKSHKQGDVVIKCSEKFINTINTFSVKHLEKFVINNIKN